MSEQTAKQPQHEYQRFLQSLPEDWDRREIRQLGTVVGGGTPSRNVPSFWRGNIPWVTPGEVSGNATKSLYDTAEHISASGLAGSGANLLPAGSLLVTTRATLGSRVINAVPMATNQGFKSIIFKQATDSSFYIHLFEKLQPELVRRASGTTFLEISGAEFASIEVPSPGPHEKRLISRVLDTLDTAIRQTGAVIEKLRQVKKALLHDLLTRGVDENGKLRPPQSEAPHLYRASLLGQIPLEWSVVSLKETAAPGPLGFADGDWIETPFITDSGYRLIQTGNIGVGDFIERADRRRYVSPETFTLLGCKFVKAGDLLICRLADPIGRACMVPEDVGPAITAVDCTILRIRERTQDTGFLLAWLNSPAALMQAQAAAAGATRLRISRSNLGQLPTPCPPVAEQVRIADRLARLDNRVALECERLQKLHMQRVGLTDDLLTGRVRVTPLLT